MVIAMRESMAIILYIILQITEWQMHCGKAEFPKNAVENYESENHYLYNNYMQTIIFHLAILHPEIRKLVEK